VKGKESTYYILDRELYIAAISDELLVWDVLVIGGGATGLGVAVDAASRGYKVLLLEQADFAKGTSSRSTKLVHGGVRYLAQGDVKLVYEALQERGLLLKNAPHLVHMQSFVIPAYSYFHKLFYGLGLTIYDMLAGKLRLANTSFLGKKAVSRLLPTIKENGLKGGIEYFDGLFDDARLAINLARTCADNGGVVLNYIKVVGLIKDANGKVAGVKAKDLESGRVFELKSKVVVNATGVFVDTVLQMDAPGQLPMVRPSQGVHVVLDKSFLPGSSALMLPKTPDGRVLFAVPWQGHVLVGTTDTPIETNSLEPTASDNEIDFILNTAGQYLVRKPSRKDVLSVFSGLRPLAAPLGNTKSTKEISRSHKLIVSPSGLITITGGKWTTYRKMAEDTMDKAIEVGGLPARACVTVALKIHGYVGGTKVRGGAAHLNLYGSDARGIYSLVHKRPDLEQQLHAKFPNIHAEVVWAVQHEMARTIEDVLARRMRILFLDARAAIDMAPKVAALMAVELGYRFVWQQKQVQDFTELANGYLLEPYRPAVPLNKDLIN
jgi:glycerol-3-phosphate dehydrogenase